MPRTFEHVPRSAWGHLRLNSYAAIHCLINHIRRLGEATGEELEETFETYPFLDKYFAKILEHLPKRFNWENTLSWWEKKITAWERAGKEHLPLVALAKEGGVDFRGRVALMLVGLVEEDSRFGTLYASLQEPLAYRRPGAELVSQILAKGPANGSDPLTVCQPLIATGLIDVINKDDPRSEWVLSVPSVLWNVIRGESEPQPVRWCHIHPQETFPEIKALISPKPFLKQLAQVPTLIKDGKAHTVVLRGTQGSDRQHIMGALARAMGRSVITVDGAAPPTESFWRRLGPLCTMARALPVIEYDLGPGETAEVPHLTGYQGPLGVLLGLEGGLNGQATEQAVTLSLPLPRLTHRQRFWQEALPGHPDEDLETISERFYMPGAYIRQTASMAVAYAALDRRTAASLDDVREASRALNRQLLDTLAQRLEVEGSWDRLVVNATTTGKLQELELRCRHREQVLEHLGQAFGSNCNRGVRALFTGVSGTGKTLAAKTLASVLGMDLYQVDLAAVINKYVGETEKNLHRILSRAEELDVILLLDEGDALLGNRTDVRSANDRYANLETDYLLQRLESYQGIVVVTTNAGENIDRAFQRRMDVVVSFIPPRPKERWHIWQLHLLKDHEVDQAYLEEVASRCAMTGGQIRNAALHATLLALDDGSAVGCGHLEQAIRSEYRKAGAICPLDRNGRERDHNASLEAFFEALSC